MPDLSSFQDGFLAKLGAGLAGSLTSLKFIKGTRVELFLMVLGGVFLSYYATPITVDFLGMKSSDGIVGYLWGLFGMAIVAKAYEALMEIDAKEIGQRIKDRISKLIGG